MEDMIVLEVGRLTQQEVLFLIEAVQELTADFFMYTSGDYQEYTQMANLSAMEEIQSKVNELAQKCLVSSLFFEIKGST
jgi:hypothetical protein